MSKKNILLIVMSIVLFIILAIAINADILSGFESWVYFESVEHMSDILTNILIFITNFGGPIGISLICITIFLIPKLRNKLGLPVSIAVSTSFILNIILKLIFARERPDILRLVTENSYSFPSGHAMINMALYTVLIIYAYKSIKSKRIKYPLIIAMMLLVIAIGFTRIYLGVHYAGDIIGGWLLGFAIGLSVYMLMKNSSINNFFMTFII